MSSALFAGPGFPATDRTDLLTTWLGCVPAALVYDTLNSLAASNLAPGGGACYDSNGSDTATNVSTSPTVERTWYLEATDSLLDRRVAQWIRPRRVACRSPSIRKCELEERGGLDRPAPTHSAHGGGSAARQDGAVT